MDRAELLERILERYQGNYDVARVSDSELPLAATAVYHERNAGYALSRKAEMWAFSRHEYVYFSTLPELTAESCTACLEQSLALGEPLIKPDGDHMCTVISVVFLCDHVSEEARAQVRRCRYRKTFRFSLQGWMEVHMVAVDLEESAVCANTAGRQTGEYLDLLLHPKKRKRTLRQILTNRE